MIFDNYGVDSMRVCFRLFHIEKGFNHSGRNHNAWFEEQLCSLTNNQVSEVTKGSQDILNVIMVL